MGRRSAKIIPLPIRQRLVCSVCGADGEGTCRCGAPYVPAGQRAAEALAANPERSDRAIAEEIGVDHKTVARARKAAAPDDAPDEATGDHSPVERRTGKDGRTRKMPKRKAKAKPKKPKKHKAADTTSGGLHKQVTALYMELKNFSNDYCARLTQWLAQADLDDDSKIGLIEVLEDTAMSLQRLAQAIDNR